MKTKEEKDILEDLKENYDKGLVSALVGAGFSKNVSDSFLGWGELLHDMVGEVYAIEFKRYYDNYLQQFRGVSTWLKPEEKVKDEFISEKIQEDDYLEYCDLSDKDPQTLDRLLALNATYAAESSDYLFTSPVFKGSSEARNQVGTIYAACVASANLDADIDTIFATAVSNTRLKM